MKALALISGGKDSCFCMMLCERQGHEIIALGNLAPHPALQRDDLDSWMFQTVGHNVIESYAQCTGLPLYRAFTQGKSISQGLSYTCSPGDEVEDLCRLVSYVKSRHPDLQAVCSGAIASDYQRLRVESVCQRLGLISLAPLWKQPQLQLLEDMLASGMQVILMKVAGMGLIPEKHLGKELSFMKPCLMTLFERYGCHICGEGGEYETLVLDCPLFRFGRIVIDASNIRRDMEGGDIAPSGVLNIQSFRVVLKTPSSTSIHNVHEVPLEFRGPEISLPCPRIMMRPGSELSGSVLLSMQNTGRFLHLSASMGATDSMKETHGTEACLSLLLTRLQEKLAAEEMTMGNAVFVHLFLKDMAHFAAANRIYCAFFPYQDPPSRACVQLSQSSPCALHVLALRKMSRCNVSRRVLHVQSISHWAPCCIGPYSQATSLGRLSFVAGQLGLVPSLMIFGDQGWQQEVQLALKHCQAVAIAVGADATRSTIKAVIYLAERFIAGLSEQENEKLQGFIHEHWPSTHLGALPELHDPDVQSYTFGVDSYLKPPKFEFQIVPIVSYVVVPALPKNANIEIQPVLLNNKEMKMSGTSFSGLFDPSIDEDCKIENMHEWKSSQLLAPVRRMRVEKASDASSPKPYAYLIFQDPGFSIVQIHFPLPAQQDCLPSWNQVQEACVELLRSCLHLCNQKMTNFVSAFLWYRADVLDESFTAEVLKGIQVPNTGGSIGDSVTWTCLPSSGIGGDVGLTDLMLIDLLALDL